MLARRLVTPPAEHFDSNPVRIEDEERVVPRLVAIVLGREVDIRATRQTPGIRLIHLVSALDLDGDVFKPNLVIAMLTPVGGSQSERHLCRWVPQVHDLLGSPIRRIPDGLCPTQRPKQVEIEREGSFDIGDGEIDVVDALCWHDSSQGLCLSDPTAPASAEALEAAGLSE